ncbi:MAG: iron(III) transport system permease protein [Alphaproteobacteria bacterium]|jgi:iron(III) transport system permease protein|nr:iron(III) transport system permease protein [Alphaproteobacteria bacterium]
MTVPAAGLQRRARIRRTWFPQVDSGVSVLWVLIAVAALAVLPPFFYVIKSSVTIPLPGFRTALGLENYQRVIEISGFHLWTMTLAFALGSSLLAIVLGFTAAWLLARTNVPFRQTVFVGAFLSLAAPLIVKGIGWILLLGPNNGLINVWLRSWFGLTGVPIELFGLGGMIFIEGLLWTPVALLLALPPLTAMDPALEEAASMSGASRWQILKHVTLPLARPAILAVLLLSFIRALEAFEVPLLIGIPGGVITVTTALYQSIHSGFVPRYGEASAYAVLLMAAVALPLALYYRATKESAKFATITGKGFRPSRIDLGKWKYPCALWVLLIPISLAAPLVLMLWASFLPIYTSPELGDLGRMSLANYLSVATREDTVSGLWNSVLVGTGSASAVAASALVMSWVVVRRREAYRWLVDVLGSLPLVFPGIVLGIAILVEFLNLRFIPIYGTIWIVIFALGIKFLPYGMRFCYSSLLSIDRQLEESARVCGAGDVKVLRAIVLPLTMPAIAATWLYVFMHAIRDLSTAILLSGAHNSIVSVVILDLWNNGEVPQVAALSILIAAGMTALGILFMTLSTRHNYRI